MDNDKETATTPSFEQEFASFTKTTDLEEAPEEIVEEAAEIEEEEPEEVIYQTEEVVEEEPDYKELFKREEQYRKTVEGRFKKSREEWLEREKELVAAKPVKEDSPVLDHAEFWETYEEMKAPVTDLIRKLIAEELNGFKQKVETIEDTVQLSTTEKHFAAIAAVHPDWREIASDPKIGEWMNTLPYETDGSALDGKTAWNIFNKGNAEEVIKLFTAYKTSVQSGLHGKNKEINLPKKPVPSVNERLVSKAVAALAVQGGSSSLPETTHRQTTSFEHDFAEFANKKR